MTDDELPIHDIEAERRTLAAMMLHPSAVEQAAEIVDEGSFFRPGHQVIFRTLVLMMAAGEPIDPVTIVAWMTENGDLRAIGGDGIYIADLAGLQVIPDWAVVYAKIVRRCATRRALISVGSRMISEARQGDVDEATMIGRGHTLLDRALTTAIDFDMQGLTADEVCDAEKPTSEPLIPNLLYPQERAMVVGPEGSGKSILGLQVGFAASAGAHPFSFEPMEPLRVLVVDGENPEHIVQRRFRTFRGLAQAYGGWDSKNLTLLHKPGGMNLTSPRDAYGMAQLIKRTRAQLVVAGPIYKMIWGVKADLESYALLAAFWDRMREDYGVALWLEEHAPYGAGGGKREMRPEGTNLWAKWCEFGVSLNYAIKKHDGDHGALDWTWFKGQRDEERRWPNWITRSRPLGTTWPWVANYDHRPEWTVPLLPEGDGG
jgi:replicative DNA helicase